MKKQYLMTPGPTPVPPPVSAKEGLPVMHHRTSEFAAVFAQASEDLKVVFQTKNDVYMIAGSGTAALESAVANLLSPGDKAIVASSGWFGDRVKKICDAYGISTVYLREPDGDVVAPQKVATALKENPDTKVVFTTHTETSTGVVNPIEEIARVVSKTPAVLSVDSVSGLAGQDLAMDAWGVDVVCTGSQKGLMTAPGLAFVSISSKAWPLVEASKSPRFYLDWRKCRKSLETKQTPFTPPVTVIVALAEALRLIKEEGLPNVFKRHEFLARAMRAGVQALGLEIFAKVPCNVLTSVRVPAGINGKHIVKRMREEYGISIAGGQGDLDGKIVRLAHMGYMEKFDTIVALAGLEMMLRTLGAPVTLGRGVAAAQEVLLHG